MRTFFALLVCSPLLAQPLEAEKLRKDGFDIFAAMLGHSGFQALPANSDAPIDSRMVIVIFGKLGDKREEWANRCRACLNHGGAVLIASDAREELDRFFPVSEGTIEIDGQQVKDPTRGYRGSTDMPFIKFRETAAFSTLGQFKRVAMNQPSFILPLRDLQKWKVVASFSDWANYSGLAIAAYVTPGSLGIVSSDAGLFANQMLADPQLDNAKFAAAVCQALAQRPDGTRRTQAYFVVNGDPLRRFPELSTDPLPPVPDVRPSWESIQKTLADGIDKKVDDWQTRDVLQQKSDRAVPASHLLRTAATVFAILAVIWLLNRLRRGREGDEAKPAVHAADVEWTALIHERLHWQWLEWNVTEPHPRLAVDGGWFYRYRIHQAVKVLQTMRGRTDLKQSDWRDAGERIARVDAALHAGTLRFVS